ncbi:MAG: YceI family protein [Gammaproteobacteria bacterium]
MINSHQLRIKIGLALLPALLFAVGQSQAEMQDWEIDPEHFSIVFAAEHIGYQQQLGFFLEGSGSFRYDPETMELESGTVEIQADSVFTNHDDRDDHLSGRDFLNVRRNPLIVFEASEFRPAEGGNGGKLMGNLTLIGETHPVTLDVTINKRAEYPFGHRRETLGISASTTILRSLWGMDYGVSNDMVGDEVSLRFEFEALQQ